MAKKRRYLKKKIISFICYGGVKGGLNLLMQANIEGVGRKIIREDKAARSLCYYRYQKLLFQKRPPGL